MKVGLIPHFSYNSSDSQNHIFGTVVEVLRQKHQIVYLPPEFIHSARGRQREMLREFLRAADVVLGPLDEAVIQVRESLGEYVPYICFLNGQASRGAQGMIKSHKLLRTTDVLLGNCTADLEIARKLFPNAQTRLLPFAVDAQTYFPMDEAARATLRAELGFKPEDRILLYSGRITLEKNVHTLLRVFAATLGVIPDLHLVVAGVDFNQPFPEVGVFTLGIRQTLVRTLERLEIPPERVHFVGHCGGDQLRGLYNIADALGNMTLHHDENFGLSQVEAMACGTPVVGTNWGGLKDTIVDGETGYKVSTIVTGSGVKVNWWEAVNRLVELLQRGPEQQRLRQRCRASVLDRYSLAPYSKRLESILAGCAAARAVSGEPLRSSAFARQYWCLCALQWGEQPPYQRGPRAYQMYRELIMPFTGSSRRNGNGGRLEAAHILCLATPVRIADNGTIAFDDPIFPFEVVPPAPYREAVAAALIILNNEPVTTVAKLLRAMQPVQGDRSDAIEWMLEEGLVLKSQPEFGGLALQSVGAQMSRPLFSVCSVPHTTDAVVVR